MTDLSEYGMLDDEPQLFKNLVNSHKIPNCPICKKEMIESRHGSGNTIEFSISCNICEIGFFAYRFDMLQLLKQKLNGV